MRQLHLEAIKLNFKMADLMKKMEIKSVLEYGGGIGEFSLV